MRNSFPADDAAARLHHTLQTKLGAAYAGYAAYALDPENPSEAYVMDFRNADKTTHAHHRFTGNALEGRQVVLASTSLPPAIRNPGAAMMIQSAQVPGHICVNRRADAHSPLILQAVLKCYAVTGWDRDAATEILKTPDIVSRFETAAGAWPETDAARHAKTPLSPTHYLVHYDVSGSERIRAESGRVARDMFTRLADDAAALAPRYGGEFFRPEGDGGWLAFPLRLQMAFDAAREARDQKIAPFAAALVEKFKEGKACFDALPDVRASALRVYAQPGYLHAIEAGGRTDYDGDAFAKIRRLHAVRTARTPRVVIADMPSPFI